MLNKSRLTLWIFCLAALLLPMFSLAQNERYDLPSGEVNGEQTYVINWSPTGEYIATGNQGGFSLWDSQTGELIERYPVVAFDHPEIAPLVTELVWNPNGTQIVIRFELPFIDFDRIQIIDIPSGNLVIDYIDGGIGSGLDWSPDGSTIAIQYTRFANDAIEIRFFDAVTGSLLQALPISDRNSSDVVKWSPDGTKFAINFNTNITSEIIVYDTNTLTEISRLPHSATVSEFSWRLNNTQIASRDASEEGGIYIWNSISGELFEVLDVEVPADLVWSPTENVIAVESRNTIYLVDLITGTILNQTTRYANLISWNPDGSMLATMNGSTPMFYTRNGQELPPFPLMVGYNITNIQTNAPSSRVYNNTFINLTELEDIENLVIQAFPNRASIQSVTLELNDEITIFNERPYILPLPPAGTYTLTGTPYTEPDAQGTQGTPLTITFTITDE